MATNQRPLVALTVGDPAGIGPEIVRAALAEPRVLAELRPIVFGPAGERPDGVEPIEPDADFASVDGPRWVAVGDPGPFELGRVQERTGRAALDALRAGAEAALEGRVAALVNAPVSKAALHEAGERVEGQTELLGRWAGAPDVQMMAVAGPLRVLLLTRHRPLVDALAAIESGLVLRHLVMLDHALRGFGFAAPRLALAGLNPHAGEGGLLGREEIEHLEPALRDARAAGLDVAGPVSPDSVFLGALEGRWDGILALYHDQAFIPAKLVAPGRGLTVLCGLPYLRVSPAHGTAFDIAGRGIASPGNLVLALRQAAAWSAGRPETLEGQPSDPDRPSRRPMEGRGPTGPGPSAGPERVGRG